MAQATLQVAVPPGAQPGQRLQVQSPDGQTIEVVLPPGTQGGQTIALAYTPARNSQESYRSPAPPRPAALGEYHEQPPQQQKAPSQHAMRQPQSQQRHAVRGTGFKPTNSKPKTCCGCCGCGCAYVCIQPDELVSLERCGAFKAIRRGGCHFLGIDWCGKTLEMQKVTTRVQETEIASMTKTKDNVFVSLIVSVQLEVMVERAYDAIYRLDDPIQQIESYVADVVRGTVPLMTLDELFASKDDIAGAVKHRLDECLGNFGFCIHQVLITDLAPDDRVKTAMNEIDVARRLRTASIEKAEAQKTLVVKAAEADAESAFLQGQGVARQRMAIADGLRSAVGGGAEMDQETVQELMLITQYFDMLDVLANGKNTTVFMPHSVSNLAQITDEIHTGISGDASSKLRQRPPSVTQI